METTSLLQLLCLLFTTIAAANPGDVKKTEDMDLGEILKSGTDFEIMMLGDIMMHPEVSFELQIKDKEDYLDGKDYIAEMNSENLGELEEKENAVEGMKDKAKDDPLTLTMYILLLLLLLLLFFLPFLLLVLHPLPHPQDATGG